MKTVMKNITRLVILFQWSHKNDSGVDTFIDYFYQQWIAKNFNWFEGAYQGKTSTDNGLESNNKWIKEYTSNSNCCCC
jgi:hypothetical protein